jgi:hypothetical protein
MSDKDVTPQAGGSDDNKPDEPVVDPREDAIEAIAQRRRDELRQEGFNLPPGGQEPDKQPEPEPEPTRKAAPEPEPEQEMVKLIVDGEEREVPLSDVLDAGTKTLQKQSTADKRLQEATELLKRARQAPPQPSARPDAEKRPEQEQAPVMSDEDIASIVSSIQYGSQEEGVEATKRLLNAVRQPGQATRTVTPEDVERIVTYRDIRTRFETSFKDIAKDPRLYAEADRKVSELIANGEPDEWATYEKAGTEVYEWFFGKKPAATRKGAAGNVTDLAGKRERKTEIEDVSGVGGSDQAPESSAPQMPTPESRSRIIREEQEARMRALNS